MRILKGWPENERKELEEAKDNGFNAIGLINGIINSENDCIFLAGRYEDESSDEDNLLARDIADYYAGVAKFPEKKYVVHDKVTGQYICFNRLTESFCWSQLWIPEKNTKEEWLEINPAYESMLVEADNEEY